MLLFFFFNDPATTEIYTLSLHDALPISFDGRIPIIGVGGVVSGTDAFEHLLAGASASRCSNASVPDTTRSEEHTSELQSRLHLVCRLLLEKKKTTRQSSV